MFKCDFADMYAEKNSASLSLSLFLKFKNNCQLTSKTLNASILAKV